jgi:hypothetical protein
MITIVLAVDNQHLDELQVSLPTWIKYKNFDKYKFLVIFDKSQVTPSEDRFEIFKNLQVEYVSWEDPLHLYQSQREKMLTALTVLPGIHVKTPWYLKIDTDCIATDNQKWFDESWLEKDYVFITNPWGSTKPANAVELLDEWAKDKGFVGSKAPLNLPFDPSEKKIYHKRIISWLFLCKTEWSAQMAKHVHYDETIYKLPSISSKEYRVSQDTFLWYVAEIFGHKYKTFQFKKKGWKHTRI